MSAAELRFLALQTESANARRELENAAAELEASTRPVPPPATDITCWGCRGTGKQADFVFSTSEPHRTWTCPHCHGTGRLPLGSKPPVLTPEERRAIERETERRIQAAVMAMVRRAG